ncbi:Cloroperoxidase [Thozetella sp. PMI_491]|nr:Cloroperoxidase [Thozetella sp. PMI_491]
MKHFLLVSAIVNGALAGCPIDHFRTWKPAGKGDARSPCPGLNSLANHGFLPHNGRNIDSHTLSTALVDSLNVAQDLADQLFAGAISSNLRIANATTFDLDDLDNHNIVEHDASMSRGDFYFGDDHTFNQTIFDETKTHWTAENLTVEMAATARLASIAISNATNPTFNITSFSKKGFGEPAAYFLAFGDWDSHTANRSFVEYVFQHERLPLELGWSRSAVPRGLADFIYTMQLISNATSSLLGEVATIHTKATHGF